MLNIYKYSIFCNMREGESEGESGGRVGVERGVGEE